MLGRQRVLGSSGCSKLQASLNGMITRQLYWPQKVRSLDLVVSKESGLGNDNFEAYPSSPAHIGYGPLSEEEILVTQLGYGGGEVFGSLERDGGWFEGGRDEEENTVDGDR